MDFLFCTPQPKVQRGESPRLLLAINFQKAKQKHGLSFSRHVRHNFEVHATKIMSVTLKERIVL